MSLKRDDVVAALRAEDVAHHLGITGQWRGRWMHARRCGETDHGSDAFAISRDGKWHCHSCDKGGDLLRLIALGEGIDIKTDFPRVLEVAAGIAGIEDPDDFTSSSRRPAPKPRPAPPVLPPLPERIATAKKRAAWVWERLSDDERTVSSYLRSRGLKFSADGVSVDQRVVPGVRIGHGREDIKATPLQIQPPPPDASADLRTLWWTFGMQPGARAIVVPVRAVDDGRMVDLRARRLSPLEGQPKIIGMVGGVTSSPAERGQTRRLIGCYGRPHDIDSDHVIVVEGLMDYLTALAVWPNAQVLGAVEAGSLALVSGHAAAALAAAGGSGRLTIVEQDDKPRLNKAGEMIAGAADRSVNEDPNAATKVAVRLLGPRRVGWLFCGPTDEMLDRLQEEALHPGWTTIRCQFKDLNDLVIMGADIPAMLRWWSDIASAG